VGTTAAREHRSNASQATMFAAVNMPSRTTLPHAEILTARQKLEE